MADFLLTQIINYGAPILGLIVFIGAMGAPFPGTLIIVAVGAFCRQGFLSWPITGLVAFICVVLGDGVSYSMGYYARESILRRFSASPQWNRAEKSFQNWGGMSIFLTRFLITGIAVPVNLLAGTGRFPFKRFLMYDLAGEAIWVFGYGGLGYLFGTHWEVVSDFISNFGGLMLGLVVLVAGFLMARRLLRSNSSKIDDPA
jgi:membrane protein DedA with SNARE-associated domain